MEDGIFLLSAKKILAGELPLVELIEVAEGLKAEGELAYASQLYNFWTHLNQNDAGLYGAYFNHAIILSAMNDLAGAKTALESAIKLMPDFYGSYVNLGSVHERLGSPGQAIIQWLELNSRLANLNGGNLDYKLTALNQIARVLENTKQPASAELFMKESLEVLSQQPAVIQHYVAMRLAQCKWPVTEPVAKLTRKDVMKGMGPLSMAVYTDDAMMQMALAHHYNKDFVGYASQDYQEQHKARRQAKPEGRRKIGYISSDLRNHAVGYVMAEFFELHGRGDCEVFVYHCGNPESDDLMERIKVGVEHWVDISKMNDAAAAARIMADGIDILVDVNGYTKEARTKLFAMHVAPVQVNWFGYPGSMGSPYHHYIIADEWIIPKGHEIYYSEKVVRLPCYQPNDRKRTIDAKRFTRAEVGLPEEGVVFCCFNGSQKITRFTFERWMTILKNVPGSVLWLLSAHESVNERLREAAIQNGVAAERIVFAPPMSNQLHLTRYLLADMFLDTSPYGAHVTASDSLWMGVPILTYSGQCFASRVCGSLSRAAGMPEMVCASHEEYVQRAIELGNNPAELQRLKEKLAANRDSCLLFDVPTLVTHIEALYKDMWSDFCAGHLPRPDLTNMDMYLECGSDLNPDVEEGKGDAAYYRAAMARHHRYSPIGPDRRLWTARDIHHVDVEHGDRVVSSPRNDNGLDILAEDEGDWNSSPFNSIKGVFKKILAL